MGEAALRGNTALRAAAGARKPRERSSRYARGRPSACWRRVLPRALVRESTPGIRWRKLSFNGGGASISRPSRASSRPRSESRPGSARRSSDLRAPGADLCRLDQVIEATRNEPAPERDGGLRGDERPQPVGPGADPPAGFIRRRPPARCGPVRFLPGRRVSARKAGMVRRPTGSSHTRRYRETSKGDRLRGLTTAEHFVAPHPCRPGTHPAGAAIRTTVAVLVVRRRPVQLGCSNGLES